MKKSVLVSGSLAYDRIFNYHGRFRDAILPEKIHVLNVSFSVRAIRESFGGNAGNIAYGLSLLGIPCAIVASVGKDFTRYRTWLKHHHVNLSMVKTVPNALTAVAYIFTDTEDNQLTAYSPGAMSTDPLRAMRGTEQSMRSIRYAILSTGNIPSTMHIALMCRKHRIPYLFDPGQSIPAFPQRQLLSVLRSADGVAVNDYELSLLLRKTGLSFRHLSSRVRYVITTYGAEGSEICYNTRRVHTRPARPKSEVDPTGAGDAFRAGFLAGILRGMTLEDAMKMGSVSSVYTVEKEGTQTHRFNQQQFLKRFHHNYQ